MNIFQPPHLLQPPRLVIWQFLPPLHVYSNLHGYSSQFEFEIDIKRGSAFIVAGGDAWWMNENDRLFMKDDLDFSS